MSSQASRKRELPACKPIMQNGKVAHLHLGVDSETGNNVKLRIKTNTMMTTFFFAAIRSTMCLSVSASGPKAWYARLLDSRKEPCLNKTMKDFKIISLDF